MIRRDILINMKINKYLQYLSGSGNQSEGRIVESDPILSIIVSLGVILEPSAKHFDLMLVLLITIRSR